MSVKYETRDGIAILTMQNPPVNGLGLSTRLGLVESLTKALDDAQIKAVVVTGDARAFSGGADIREFNKPEAEQEPTLPTVIDAFERSSKPVVAAIEGMALGGGLELALGMNHRVADKRGDFFIRRFRPRDENGLSAFRRHKNFLAQRRWHFKFAGAAARLRFEPRQRAARDGDHFRFCAEAGQF